jgi:hypothetical protein
MVVGGLAIRVNEVWAEVANDPYNLTPNPFPSGKGNRMWKVAGALRQGGEDFAGDFAAFQIA